LWITGFFAFGLKKIDALTKRIRQLAATDRLPVGHQPAPQRSVQQFCFFTLLSH
jgi:hypothetical protein